MERFHWKSSGQECSLFALAAATTPSLAVIRDQFIDGLGCFWKCAVQCGSLSVLIHPHLLGEESMDKWPQKWPAWKVTLLTCCSRAKSFFPVLFTPVHAGAHIYMSTTSQWSACFALGTQGVHVSVSSSSEFWAAMQFWFFPSLTKPDTHCKKTRVVLTEPG